jgi:hypothetical protein
MTIAKSLAEAAEIWKARQAKPEPVNEKVAIRKQVVAAQKLPKSTTGKIAAYLAGDRRMLEHEITKNVIEERAIKDWRKNLIASAGQGEPNFGMPKRFKVEMVDSKQLTDANGGIRADARITDTKTGRSTTINALNLGVMVRAFSALFPEAEKPASSTKRKTAKSVGRDNEESFEIFESHPGKGDYGSDWKRLSTFKSREAADRFIERAMKQKGPRLMLMKGGQVGKFIAEYDAR